MFEDDCRLLCSDLHANNRYKNTPAKRNPPKNARNISKVASKALMCQHMQDQVSACSTAGGVLLTPGERRRESG